MRTIQNTTSSDIFIEDIGVTVDANSSLLIHPNNYGKFASSSDIDSPINTGNLRIILNGITLNASDSLSVIKDFSPYIQGQETSGNQSVTNVLKKIKVDGVSLTLTPNSSSEAILAVNSFAERLYFAEVLASSQTTTVYTYPLSNSDPDFLKFEVC
tara:strand:+ start:557 stop:1024 length:468 start_codon:yes stop_codon:yes gene_type:complete